MSGGWTVHKQMFQEPSLFYSLWCACHLDEMFLKTLVYLLFNCLTWLLAWESVIFEYEESFGDILYAYACARLNFTDPPSINFLLNFLHLIFSSVQFSSTVLLKRNLKWKFNCNDVVNCGTFCGSVFCYLTYLIFFQKWFLHFNT